MIRIFWLEEFIFWGLNFWNSFSRFVFLFIELKIIIQQRKFVELLVDFSYFSKFIKMNFEILSNEKLFGVIENRKNFQSDILASTPASMGWSFSYDLDIAWWTPNDAGRGSTHQTKAADGGAQGQLIWVAQISTFASEGQYLANWYGQIQCLWPTILNSFT